MKLELGDIFPIYDETFMVVEKATFMDNNYILVNKLDEEGEPINELFIYKTTENGVMLVTDKKLLDVLMPILSNKLQRDINEINNENKYNIN